jgi:anti-sigma regulatory factor (Ser/Thr protein kinase)
MNSTLNLDPEKEPVSRSSSGSDVGHPDCIFRVSEISQVGEVRRAAVTIAARLGFDDTACGKTALVVTEAATNIIKHGGGGDIIVRVVQNQEVNGVEIVALDLGPGLADPDRCFRDGFSTVGTPGTGLGAIRRLSSFVDLYSRKDGGTALVARVWARPTVQPAPPENVLDIGAVCLAKTGEPASGDSWAYEGTGDRAIILVADGLGHGEFAAAAAREAVRLLRAHAGADPVGIIQTIHGGLRGTRGAAIALACVEFKARRLRYVGVGNISAAVIAGPLSQRMVSHNGTAGAEARKIQEFVYPFPPEALLVMHSDGIATHWSLDAYPGLVKRDPALIAGVLYRDFTRGRDDATVLAMREVEMGFR